MGRISKSQTDTRGETTGTQSCRGSLGNGAVGLESGAPPSVVILYTGDTQSHLEPCGCYQEQSGGLPRRAYVVDEIRRRGFPTLLVDAGNIFDGEAEIDARRCETNMMALAVMGYSAVALSASDLAYADTYLSEQRAIATFPFLAPRAARRFHAAVRR